MKEDNEEMIKVNTGSDSVNDQQPLLRRRLIKPVPVRGTSLIAGQDALNLSASTRTLTPVMNSQFLSFNLGEQSKRPYLDFRKACAATLYPTMPDSPSPVKFTSMLIDYEETAESGSWRRSMADLDLSEIENDNSFDRY
ncbi:hypothetical protein ACOME3_010344 [Neoechinorhynchus agilis]